jgi:hypothetical protein
VDRSWVIELLLPRTDAGVAVQVVITLALATGVIWRVRRDSVLRFFFASLTFFVLGLFVLRGAH